MDSQHIPHQNEIAPEGKPDSREGLFFKPPPFSLTADTFPPPPDHSDHATPAQFQPDQKSAESENSAKGLNPFSGGGPDYRPWDDSGMIVYFDYSFEGEEFQRREGKIEMKGGQAIKAYRLRIKQEDEIVLDLELDVEGRWVFEVIPLGLAEAQLQEVLQYVWYNFYHQHELELGWSAIQALIPKQQSGAGKLGAVLLSATPILNEPGGEAKGELSAGTSVTVTGGSPKWAEITGQDRTGNPISGFIERKALGELAPETVLPDAEIIANPGTLAKLRETGAGPEAYLLALQPADMAFLNLEERKAILKYLAGGDTALARTFNWVTGSKERIIADLIRACPKEQFSELWAWLMANQAEWFEIFHGRIHGDEYKDFQNVLESQITGYIVEETSPEAMEGEFSEMQARGTDHPKVIPWANPSLVGSFFNRSVAVKTEYVEEEGETRLRVIYFEPGREYGLKTFRPDEIIGIRFLTDEPELNASEGEMRFMPAIRIRHLEAKASAQSRQDFFDILMVFTGIGELAVAARAAQFGWRGVVAAADVLLGATDLAIQGLRPQLMKSEAGRKFLGVWDIVQGLAGVFGVGQVLAEVPGLFKRLRKSWQEVEIGDAAGQELDRALAEMEDAELRYRERETGSVQEQANPVGGREQADPGHGSGQESPDPVGGRKQADPGHGKKNPGPGNAPARLPVTTTGPSVKFVLFLDKVQEKLSGDRAKRWKSAKESWKALTDGRQNPPGFQPAYSGAVPGNPVRTGGQYSEASYLSIREIGDEVEQAAASFANKVNQIKKGGDPEKTIELLASIARDMSVGFIELTAETFIHFIRKLLPDELAHLTDQRLAKLFKTGRVVLSPQAARQQHAFLQLTREQRYQIVEYWVKHPGSKRRLEDLMEDVRSGKVLNPETGYFRQPGGKEPDFKSGIRQDGHSLQAQGIEFDEETQIVLAEMARQRQEIREELSALGTDIEEHKALRKELIGKIGQASEQIAEVAAERYMRTELKNFYAGESRSVTSIKKQWPPEDTERLSRKGEFDQVWEVGFKDGSTELVIVEVKGGQSSPKGQTREVKKAEVGREYVDKHVEQGSRGYALDVAIAMRDRGIRKENKYLKELGSEINEGVKNKKIRYLHFSVGFDKTTGNIKSSQIHEFDISQDFKN